MVVKGGGKEGGRERGRGENGVGLIVSIDRGRVELTLSYRSTLNPIIAIVSLASIL